MNKIPRQLMAKRIQILNGSSHAVTFTDAQGNKKVIPAAPYVDPVLLVDSYSTLSLTVGELLAGKDSDPMELSEISLQNGDCFKLALRTKATYFYIIKIMTRL